MPTSIKIAVGVLAVVIAMGIWLLFKNQATEIGAIASALFAPVLSLVSIVGVFLRKNWARYIASILIFIMGVGPAAALLFVGKVGIAAVVVMAIEGLLFVWLAYAVYFGKPSKQYFQL